MVATALRRVTWAGLACLVLGIAPALAQAPEIDVTIAYLTRDEPPLEPLSLAQPILTDEGWKGIEQGIADNATTGRFLGHAYEAVSHTIPRDGDAGEVFQAALDAGERFFVADLRKEDLLAIAPLADEAGAIVFNSRATDDDLRTDLCFSSVFHTAASRAMKADALAQYLLWKRWTNWFLLHGSHPADIAYAEAVRRAATKFGARLVEDRAYEDTGGARRTDTGHVQVQRQMPVLTQTSRDYDVLIVADESEVFGDYVPYRTWEARPVVGTSGLVPATWDRVTEQWGGTQMQRRFERFAGRPMTERDFNAWMAVRSVGEAVTRTSSADPKVIRDYILGDRFELAAFKGQALSFRHWNQQLRQPILLVSPRTLVSVSPQDQFLHQRTPLDTLGFDLPESNCHLNPE